MVSSLNNNMIVLNEPQQRQWYFVIESPKIIGEGAIDTVESQIASTVGKEYKK